MVHIFFQKNDIADAMIFANANDIANKVCNEGRNL